VAAITLRNGLAESMEKAKFCKLPRSDDQPTVDRHGAAIMNAKWFNRQIIKVSASLALYDNRQNDSGLRSTMPFMTNPKT
jgi:hypothetical protein